MIANRIEGFTHPVRKPPDWDDEKGACATLFVKLEELHGGLVGMTSSWQPTPEELVALAHGAPVYLRVLGTKHPPVELFVGPVPGDEGGDQFLAIVCPATDRGVEFPVIADVIEKGRLLQQ